MTTQQAGSVSGDLGIDDWLDHGQGGGGGAFLSGDWQDDGSIRIWLHPAAPIRVLYRHPWKECARNGKKVRMTRFTSMEREFILQKQNFRNDDGSREHPPEICPFSLLLEWVYDRIQDGKIGWTSEIFQFRPSDGDAEVIHAGGFCGLFQDKKLTDAQKDAIRKLGIRSDETYKEDCRASEQTVFIVVRNDDPDAGPLIAPVGRGLAQAFKDAVKNRRKQFSKNPELADPIRHPTCFEWSVDKSGPFKRFVIVATDDDLTDKIKAQFAAPLPDTERLFAPSNVALLRKQFEEAWIHKVVPPWDLLFAKAMAAVKGTPAAELDSAFDYGANAPDSGAADDVISSGGSGSKTITTVAAVEPEVSKCDNCGGSIADEVFDSTPVLCPHCGIEYRYDEAAEEWKPVPKETGAEAGGAGGETPPPRKSGRRKPAA